MIDKKRRDLAARKSTALLRDINNLAMQPRKVCCRQFLFREIDNQLVKPGEFEYYLTAKCICEIHYVTLLRRLYSFRLFNFTMSFQTRTI